MDLADVVLPPLAPPVDQLWHVVMDLAEELPGAWTLIGGQMVLLHAVQHGAVPAQISQDGDVVADVRAAPEALPRLAASLTRSAFELDISAGGIGHRFVRPAQPRPVVVDVLAPEGLRPGVSLVTIPPGRTVQAPGGTQALARSELVAVHHEGRRGVVPRPSLLGAVVLKAAAVGLGGDVSRHLRDLALLCSLVPDPFELVEGTTRKDRARLRRVVALRDDTHPAWAALGPRAARDGRAALQILGADPS